MHNVTVENDGAAVEESPIRGENNESYFGEHEIKYVFLSISLRQRKEPSTNRQTDIFRVVPISGTVGSHVEMSSTTLSGNTSIANRMYPS